MRRAGKTGKSSSVDMALQDEHAIWLEAIAKERDRAAFAKLFRYYAPRLKAFAMKGGLSAEEAEEIMQEALVTLWRKADRFDRTKAAASTWIFTIVRNKRIDYLRREKRPDLKAEDFLHMETEEPAADISFADRQQANTIRDRMTSLPADQLVVIRKAFFENKSHSEVASELGLPLGTVKSRIRLALARMRGMMEKE